MKIYKVVPYAGTLVAKKKDVIQDKIVEYFDVINQECLDGWELVTVAPLNAVIKRGGLNTRPANYNVFIFSKEIGNAD